VLAANGRLLAALGSLSLSDLAGSLEREFEQCRSGGATVELDREIVLPGQTECWHFVLAPLPEGGPTGRAVGRMLVTVSGRQRAAPADISYPESRIRAIVEEQAGLICRYEPDSMLTFVNDAYTRRFGRDPATLVGRRIVDLVPADETARLHAALSCLTPAQPLGRTERPATLPDGSRIWLLWSDRAFFDADGKVTE